MKPFAVTLSVRNNLLKERRIGLNLTIRELAERSGVGYADLCALESMRESPLRVRHMCRSVECVKAASAITKYRCKAHKIDDSILSEPLKRRWSKDAEKLALFFGCAEYDLWPDEILAVKTAKAEVKMSAFDVATLIPALEPIALPDDVIDQNEKRQAIEGVLATLNKREAGLLRMRFGIDDDAHTKTETAAKLKLSKSRVDQIENMALRKLRHPRRSKSLAPWR